MRSGIGMTQAAGLAYHDSVTVQMIQAISHTEGFQQMTGKSTLEFYGAAGEVTGSCHRLRIGDRQILLDCGMIQGGRRQEARNAEPFPFEPAQIDAVILSHAHIDHCGRLPLLVKRGFSGPIHVQNASAELTDILLRDSAFIAEMDSDRQNRKRQRQGLDPIDPLFDEADVERTLSQLERSPYHQWIDVLPGLRLRFLDAGHIMGSTVVELDVTTDEGPCRLIFSGDLGQYDTPILRDPESPTEADLVIMESTYGSRLHRSREPTIREMGQIIQQASPHKGNILIPAFSVGRTQEMLYHFGTHFQDWGLDRWDIVLDSPLAIRASAIYWNYTHLYDEEATERLKARKMPPLPNLILSKTREESMAINRRTSGQIILAGSGMCTGGRIVHHLKHNLWRPHARVIIVGYQAMGSLGRKLVDGHQTVRIHQDTIRVNASIHTVGGLSAHADQDDLVRWYRGIAGSPDVFLVHGEPESGQRLSSRLISDAGAASATVASPGLTIDLARSGRTQRMSPSGSSG